LFVVRDSILELIDVNPVYFSAETAVIKGIEDGTLIVSRQVPGAYEGMQVRILENNNQ